MPLTATPTTYAQVAANTHIYDTKWGSHFFGTSSNTQAWAKCTYYIDCSYSGIVTFLQNLNGVFQGTDSNGNPTTTYQLPMTCPIWDAILVSQVEVKPFGVDSTCGCDKPYTSAEVEVTFSTPQYAQTGDNTLLRVDYDVANEIASLPGSAYTFQDGTRGEVGIGIPVVTTAINITRYRVPRFDIQTFQSVVGKVNSAPFFGFAAGLVLCDPIRSSTNQQFGGITLSDFTYGFRARSIPWNQALNPNSGQWEVYSPQTLQTADMNVLFNS